MMQKLLFGLVALVTVVQCLKLEELGDLVQGMNIFSFFLNGEFLINEKTCIEMSYNGSKTALTVTFSMNDKVLFSRTVSANNPPPICVGHPAARVMADICFDFYNVQMSLDEFKVCLDIQPRVFLRKITNIKVGCLTFEGDEEEEE
ncbi:DUF4773 domain-containing protein [Nephila pilipes]|uniref:DUF4773 domain-containing protein n=1 Tax=Nephila pilipes TaxID=299642 RepID=A0A8X6PVP9_NEPPI|nr:DUF4773 domain-containing protein [Nephila pilipes]